MNPNVQFMNGMDERLKFVLESVKKAVEMFLSATKDMEYACKFKAFDMVGVKESDKGALVEVIKEAFAIEIGNQAKDTIKEITYSYYVEDVEDKSVFWFNAVKEVPDYDKLAPAEEESEPKVKEIEEVAEEVVSDESDKENEVVLPHPSAMPAYKRTGSE